MQISFNRQTKLWTGRQDWLVYLNNTTISCAARVTNIEAYEISKTSPVANNLCELVSLQIFIQLRS